MQKQFTYVGTIDSSDLNKANNEVLNDLETMNIRLNKIHAMQEEYEFIEGISNLYLEKAINDIYKKQDKVEGLSIIRPDSFTNISNTYINYDKLYANKSPIKSINKLVLDNMDTSTYIPDDLIIEAVTDKEYVSVKDNDIKCIVENSNKPWVREITADDTTKEVYTTVFIHIPFSIMANDYVNQISFSTFPFNTAKVVDIQYMDEYNTNKMLDLNEIKFHKGCIINDYDIPYSSNKNHICLNFKKIKAKVIGITIKQDECIQDGNFKKFYLGLRDLKVLYNEYQSEVMEFSLDFKPPSPDGVHVEKIEVIYNNDFKEHPTIQIYELDNNKETILHTDFIDFSTSYKTIRFKFLYKQLDNIPNINKIKIFYKNL